MSGMKKFALQAGAKLLLQFLDNPKLGRFQVTIIGYVEGSSLMITAPMSNGSILLLREGQQFIVRLLSGTQIIGFNSEVLKVYNNPFSYVHLKPPIEVEQLNVRNAHRVELDLIASVNTIERDEESGKINRSSVSDAIASKINNMSTTGCQIQMVNPLPEESRELMISMKITVAEQERLLSIDAVVRSHREAEIENNIWHIYGLQFNELDDGRRLLLHGYVYEKLVKEIY
jgi:c-di-GMP-binding flagellar brake protein YcgR